MWVSVQDLLCYVHSPIETLDWQLVLIQMLMLYSQIIQRYGHSRVHIPEVRFPLELLRRVRPAISLMT